jgi:fumarylacetoacetase
VGRRCDRTVPPDDAPLTAVPVPLPPLPGTDPRVTSTAPSTWLDLPADTGFGPANLPYGVFSTPGTGRRTGVAIGDLVLDLPAATGDPVYATGSLNAFMAQGPEAWRALRARLTGWLTDASGRDAVEPHLLPRAEVRMHLPVEVADYVDFYSSRHHAENLGRMFRPDSPPLTPNWTHLPIGYHGRAGTVAVSGTPVVRPNGQRKAPADDAPTFGPSQRLDIEAEVGFVVGTPSELGRPVPLTAFADHVFGVCLVNDWSARDLQSWEYVPLGPFLGKSFLTSVSPWVVPLAALEAARVRPPERDPRPLPYLDDSDQPWGLDITLEVRLNGELLSCPPFASLYWTAAQQLAHMTVNGASLRTGDLFASGTVSGPRRDQRGSFIELSWGGREPLTLADGTTRTFLEDGDVVSITATAPGPGGTRIAFGEVTGRIEPAR